MDYIEENEIVKNHGLVLPNNQVFLTKPLGVFKKVYQPSDLKNKDEMMNLVNNTGIGQRRCGETNSDIGLVFSRSFTLGIGLNLTPIIANLILPAGAIVNLANDSNKKMRASRAVCWSLVGIQDGRYKNVACSGLNTRFLYYPAIDQNIYEGQSQLKDLISDASRLSHDVRYSKYGRNCVFPSFFGTTNLGCSGGIHFFLNHESAINY
jgi:hypothetical protein